MSKYPYFADPDCVKYRPERRWEVLSWDRQRRPVTLGTVLAEIRAILTAIRERDQ